MRSLPGGSTERPGPARQFGVNRRLTAVRLLGGLLADAQPGPNLSPRSAALALASDGRPQRLMVPIRPDEARSRAGPDELTRTL